MSFQAFIVIYPFVLLVGAFIAFFAYSAWVAVRDYAIDCLNPKCDWYDWEGHVMGIVAGIVFTIFTAGLVVFVSSTMSAEREMHNNIFSLAGLLSAWLFIRRAGDDPFDWMDRFGRFMQPMFDKTFGRPIDFTIRICRQF